MMNLDTNHRLTRRAAIGGALFAALAMHAPAGASSRRTRDAETWESEDGALAVS